MQPTSGSGGSALPAGKKTRHGSHSQRARSISELVDGGLLTRAAGAHLRDAALSGHAGVQQALDDLEATGSAAAVLRLAATSSSAASGSLLDLGDLSVSSARARPSSSSSSSASSAPPEQPLQPMDSDLARGLLADLPPSALLKGGGSRAASSSYGAGQQQPVRGHRYASGLDGMGMGLSGGPSSSPTLGGLSGAPSPRLGGRGNSPMLLGGSVLGVVGGGSGGSGRARAESLFGAAGLPPPLLAAAASMGALSGGGGGGAIVGGGERSIAGVSLGPFMPPAAVAAPAAAPAPVGGRASMRLQGGGSKRPRGHSSQFVDMGSFDDGSPFASLMPSGEICGKVGGGGDGGEGLSSGALGGGGQTRSRVLSDFDGLVSSAIGAGSGAATVPPTSSSSSSSSASSAAAGGRGGGNSANTGAAGGAGGASLMARHEGLGLLQQRFPITDIWDAEDDDSDTATPGALSQQGGMRSGRRAAATAAPSAPALQQGGAPKAPAAPPAPAALSVGAALAAAARASAATVQAAPEASSGTLYSSYATLHSSSKSGRSRLGGGAAEHAAAPPPPPAPPPPLPLPPPPPPAMFALRAPPEVGQQKHQRLRQQQELPQQEQQRQQLEQELQLQAQHQTQMQAQQQAQVPQPLRPQQPERPAPLPIMAAAAALASTRARSGGGTSTAASRAAAVAAADGNLESQLGDEAGLGPAMARLLRQAPRFVEGSLVPQVRETTVAEGIAVPTVPVIPGWVGAYPLEVRTRRLALFLAKRQRRVWAKTVKYDVRKSFADSRLRVKGRFVKKEDEALLRDFCQLL